MCQFSLIKDLLILNNFWLNVSIYFLVGNLPLAADRKVAYNSVGTIQQGIIILTCTGKCQTLFCHVSGCCLSFRRSLNIRDSQKDQNLFRFLYHVICQNRGSLAVLSCIFKSTLCQCFVMFFRCFLFYLVSPFNLF